MPTLFTNERGHMTFALITLLLSFLLSILAVFGTIQYSTDYLVFLPVSFMFFVSSLFGFLALSEEQIDSKKFKNFVSIEISAAMFAVLLVPMAAFFTFL